VGHPVVRLVRTRIGPLADPSLTPGSYRPLTFDEVRGLAAAAVPSDDITEADRHPDPVGRGSDLGPLDPVRADPDAGVPPPG